MSAPITDSDRAAAHALLERVSGRECISNTDVHAVSCGDVAQAIADARDAERSACVEWVRDAEGDGVANDLAVARATCR